MLWGNMHTEVLKRLHELLRIDAALKGTKDKVLRQTLLPWVNYWISERWNQARADTSATKWKPQGHTSILPVDAFHHKLQVFLIVLQIVNKLLKVQLSIRLIFLPF